MPEGLSVPHPRSNRFHNATAECDYEPDYDPSRLRACHCRGLTKASPAVQAEQGSPTPSPAEAKAQPAPEPKPATPPRSGLAFSGRKAEIVPKAALQANLEPAKPVEVDYIIDKEHTIQLWDLGLAGLYHAHVFIDDVVFGWKQHLPRDQFKLSDFAL